MKKIYVPFVMIISFLVLGFLYVSCENQKVNNKSSEIEVNEDLLKNSNDQKIERWEYTILASGAANGMSNNQTIERANQLGVQGWELVGQGGAYGNGLLFKRKLP